MGKKKLAGIIVACTIAIILTIVLVISPSLQTPKPEEEEDYAVYVWHQHQEALEIYSKLNDLAKDPQPDSITWTHETTNCIEQLEHIKAELTTTHPPRYLTDTLLADTIYETSLDCIGHLTKSAYLLLDAAHAEYMADELSESPAMRMEYQLKALDYLREAKAELDESGEERDLLGPLLATCLKP
jgi:hypothetical protein